MASPPQSTNQDTPRGFAFTVGAYLLWGFLPIYMKALAHIPPAEIIAHRVIWSVPIAAMVLLLLGRTKDIRAAFRNPRMLAMATLTAVLVSVNWGIFVWAIATDRALDAALGYFINPLFSVALGAIFLGERLTKLQGFAIALAVLGVGYLTLSSGTVPWVALGLTLSWGMYGFYKKSLPLGANQGFLLEILVLLPIAVGYVLYLSIMGENHLTPMSMSTVLLVGCGAVTAAPLMLYANGVKGLRLSTVGILQYMVPTMIFLTAVFVFGEPYEGPRAIAFPMIWLSVAVYSLSLLPKRESHK